MQKLLLFVFLLTSIHQTMAGDDDHQLSKITGEKIDLVTQGHTIAGYVNGKIILGNVSGQHHGVGNLTLVDHGQTIQAAFKKTDNVWGGTIVSKKKKTSLTFVKLIKEEDTFVINANGKEYKVKVEYDKFEGNHFSNPRYITEIDGKTVQAHLVKGKACYMYSLHLIFMIFGSYLH